MKRCPECGRTFTNSTLKDCLSDGTPLVEDTPNTVSYYGAPLPASPEPFAASETAFGNRFQEPNDLEDDSEDDDLEDDDSEDGFEETALPSATPQTPAYGLPPYAAPPVMPETPPPYFAAQTRKPRTPWGVLLVAALAGVGLARFALRHNPPAAPSVSSSPVTASPGTTDTMPDLFPGLKLDSTLTQTPDGTLRQSLIAAVNNADTAEAKSFSTLSPAPLHEFYAGPALADELNTVQSLKKAGTTQEGKRVAQRFKNFQVNPDHTKAQVDVAETWNTLIRSKASGKVTHKDLDDANSQIISLTHTAHGWVVEDIQFYKFSD